MGQQVKFVSKLNFEKVGVAKANSKKWIVNKFRPETKWANHEQVEGFIKLKQKDWTCACGKKLRWFVIRGESPNKLGNSWFSAKSI